MVSLSLPRRAGAWPCACWLAVCIPLGDGAAAASETKPTAPDSSLAVLLDSISTLEAARDAKCYATATRLEEFIFGTPLTDTARFRKNELQKVWLRDAWARASAEARAGGEPELSAARIGAVLAQALPFERDEAGDATVTLAAGGSVVLARRDFEHYASVAYSLRALLAVQQDALLAGERDLLPLDPADVAAMKERLDLATLATLSLADRAAREGNEPAISEDALVNAWLRVVGVAHSGAPAPRGAGAGSAPSLLREIAIHKLASYEAYNAIGGDARQLFRANIQHYYARYILPLSGEGRAAFEAALDQEVARWTGSLLARATALSRAAGEGIVRAAPVHQALQALTPHEMNRFEDATFFPHLPRPQQVVLEAYDLDSYRDFGAHWVGILAALDQSEIPAAEVDPFAAELLAEGAAQYAVLLLRLTGDIARERLAGEMRPSDLRAGAERVAQLAVLDAAARGPDDPTPPPRSAASDPSAPTTDLFTEATAAVGLAFEHRSSDWLQQRRRAWVQSPPTFSGGGIAAEDVDGDLLPDLLLLGGGGNALLLNDGRGGFRDVTAEAGLRYVDAEGKPAEARQPLIVDLDNDGLQDIVITLVNEDHRVYHNRGGAHFEDVSAAAGLGGKGLIGGPATAFDFDRDGLLDLYIGYFGDYLAGELPLLARNNFNALPNRLFRNLGGMRFADVTAGSGADNRGWTQAVAHTDFDLDGWQDLIVANDYGRNAFLRNLGDGRFEDRAVALGADESAHSMNIGIADLNWDNHPDIYISNIVSMVKDDKYVLPAAETVQHAKPEALARMRVVESNTLYVSKMRDGNLSYLVSAAVGRGRTSTGWAWDADFFDFDNDGDDDLYCLNGTNDYYIFAEARYQLQGGELRSYPYSYARESKVLFRNEHDAFVNASEGSGADFVGNSRAAAYLDFDADGDLDIAINGFHETARFLRNNAERSGHHWLKVRLQGDPAHGSSRDAIGARIVAGMPDGGRLWREIHGGSGYLSMDPKEQHFGLGRNSSADLWIVWPNGEEQFVRGLAADRAYRIVQGREGAELVRATGGSQ